MVSHKLRKAFMLIALLFFPVTINYVSPYLPIAAATNGIIAGSIIVFACLFIVSVFIGRAFCGWFCPVGSLLDLCAESRTKRITGIWVNWIRNCLFIIWFSFLTAILVKAGGIKNINFKYMMDYGVSIDNVFGLIRYYVIVIPIVGLSYLFGRRTFCKSLCWISPFMIAGKFIGNTFHIPALKLKTSTENCISCNRCTDGCPMSLDVKTMVCKGEMKNSECVMCGKCVDSCPKRCIRFSFAD